jgi:predicted kinase
MTPPLVLHLNGAPAVGKSTLAARWADAHPGTLLLDIDVLRTWVSGWRGEYAATGSVIRPVALAVLAAYVGQGRDVVLPQLLADPAELARFRATAEEAGGRWVEVLLEAEDVTARFAGRQVDQPYLEAVHQLVEEADVDQLNRYAERLGALADATAGAIRIRTRDGEVDAAYDALDVAVRAACG